MTRGELVTTGIFEEWKKIFAEKNAPVPEQIIAMLGQYSEILVSQRKYHGMGTKYSAYQKFSYFGDYKGKALDMGALIEKTACKLFDAIN